MFALKKVIITLIFLSLVLNFYQVRSDEESSILITVYIGDFCSSTVPSAPVKALPREDFYVNVQITSNADISGVNATLNCDSSFIFPYSEYPQTVNVGDMSAGETKTIEWMIVTPLENNTYTLSVTTIWGTQSYTSDEATVRVNDDIYGFETTSKDISDDLYVYTDKTYTTLVTSVCHNDIIYLHATGGLTDNSYMYGYFHLVYHGDEHDTVVATIEKSCAIINGELNVELDLSKVDGGKLRENGTYYILMSAKDNLTVDSTRVYGESQTFTYQVCEGGGDKSETVTPLPTTTPPPETAQAGFNIPPIFLLGVIIVLGYVAYEMF